MYELADMPATMRENALFGDSRPSFPYSLNNVTADATSGGYTGCNPCGHEKALPGEHTTPPHFRKVQGPASLLERWDSDWSNDHKRSILDSALAEWFSGVKWSTSIWPFLAMYKEQALEILKIQDTEYNPYRVYQFRSCYWKDTNGFIHTNVENPEDRYRQRFRCGESACLDCRDSDRKILALEWVERWKQIVEQQPGCPGAIEMGFTLPEEFEALPLESPDLEKKYLDGIHSIIREVFGVSSRSNLLCHLSVHPVGDRDLFRDRFHVHADILPCEIVKDKRTKEKTFRWLEPVHVTSKHNSVDWQIDLDWLRKRYNQLLEELFGVTDSHAIQPQVSWVPYSEKSWRYKKCRDRKDQVFWGIVAHKLKYAMRGFGRDIENAVLRSDQGVGLCVLKSKRGEQIHWTITPVGGVVQRFKWIRDHNKVRTRGFGQCLQKYEDVLHLEASEDEMPETIKTDAKVEIIRQKTWDRESKKVKWIRDEIYKWTCPITGNYLEKNKKELKPWKGKSIEGG